MKVELTIALIALVVITSGQSKIQVIQMLLIIPIQVFINYSNVIILIYITLSHNSFNTQGYPKYMDVI